jgi:vitellogenic carboxypeptidase-like protein
MMALIVPALLATLSPYANLRSAGTVRTAASSGKATVLTSKLPHDHRSAQDEAHVHLKGYNATELYSGFFEIDAATGSNSFFIYSTPVSGRTDAPVLLWLNGGPGASSLLGFFDELGPFGISEKLEIEPRAVGWALDAHLIAIDNPLGVGYSHTSVLERMATNQTTVGDDLYEALHQFFQLFPNLRANALCCAALAP